MKKSRLLQKIIAAAFGLPLVFSSGNGFAQAYDMIYRDSTISVTPSQSSHAFSLYLYQNCDLTPLNYPAMPVSYNMNASPQIIETATGGLTARGMGTPFCAAQPAVCSAAGPLNYQKTGMDYMFSTKLNFAGPSPVAIETRTMLAGGFGNFTAANITGNFSYDPRIFNLVVNGMVNYPPAFVNPPVIFANVNQPVSFSSGATDIDGDSLVYRLRPVFPNAPYAAGFTYLNPVTANPALALNSRTGVLTFRPTAYDPAAGPGATANKYVIGLDVDEYRKINGAVTKIGTMQRNILINIVSFANNSPVLSATYHTAALAPDTIVDAYPGNMLEMRFAASDPDAANYVYPVSNARAVLPGASYSMTLGQNPNGSRLGWTPTAADVREEPHFFNVSATDDACPYPASITRTYGIRVRNITGLKPEVGRAHFAAFPNPFTETVQLKITPQNQPTAIRIYNLTGQEIDGILVPANGGPEQQVTWTNAGKFKAGTYLARLVSGDKTIQTIRFMKLP